MCADDAVGRGFAHSGGMAGSCCEPRGGEIFTSGYARHLARRYRRRGLDRTARRMVEMLTDRGVAGRSVLEIGGGVGAIQLELLARGASAAVNVELSPSYEDEAALLAHERGVADRMTRRMLDVAVGRDDLQPADLVVLHRVVCCYPDYERLLGAAADLARESLIFSHPPRNPASRALVAVQNGLFRLRRWTFRTFAHPPEEMVAVGARHGLRRTGGHPGLVWQVQLLER